MEIITIVVAVLAAVINGFVLGCHLHNLLEERDAKIARLSGEAAPRKWS